MCDKKPVSYSQDICRRYAIFHARKRCFARFSVRVRHESRTSAMHGYQIDCPCLWFLYVGHMTDPTSAAPATNTDEEWRDFAKGFVKGELKRQNLTYEDLAQRLIAMGVNETETSIRNKVSRGTFSFVFALQAMTAIGVQLRPSRTSHSHEMELPPELLRRP